MFFYDIINLMRIRTAIISSILCVTGVFSVYASDCGTADCGENDALAVSNRLDWSHGFPAWQSFTTYSDGEILTNLPVEYIRNNDTEVIDLYNDTMNSMVETNARIEELLSPQRPSNNLWTDDTTAVIYESQDTNVQICDAFGPIMSDGCPFDTPAECDIWRRKPVVRESVSPRSSQIRNESMNDFIATIQTNGMVDANNPVAAPFVNRYKMLMRSAQACCTEGMIYKLKNAGASSGLVYKFLSDDANFYNIGSRCLMTGDNELNDRYPNSATADVIADVRNSCLCSGKSWFTAMLAPFKQAYSESVAFEQSPFMWTYVDGLNREITVSINQDVKTVFDILDSCH